MAPQLDHHRPDHLGEGREVHLPLGATRQKTVHHEHVGAGAVVNVVMQFHGSVYAPCVREVCQGRAAGLLTLVDHQRVGSLGGGVELDLGD